MKRNNFFDRCQGAAVSLAFLIGGVIGFLIGAAWMHAQSII